MTFILVTLCLIVLVISPAVPIQPPSLLRPPHLHPRSRPAATSATRTQQDARTRSPWLESASTSSGAEEVTERLPPRPLAPPITTCPFGVDKSSLIPRRIVPTVTYTQRRNSRGEKAAVLVRALLEIIPLSSRLPPPTVGQLPHRPVRGQFLPPISRITDSV